MMWDPPHPALQPRLQVTRQPQVAWTAMPSPHASRLAGALVQPPGSPLVLSPSLHRMWGLDFRPGLSNLAGQKDLWITWSPQD